MSKIASFDAQLVTATDRIFRISAWLHCSDLCSDLVAD
jgi:hypothetical protein